MMRKHAILLMVHNNLECLKELINSFDSEYFDIYVHIDKKSFINIDDLEDLTIFSNLFVYKIIDVRWGDYSQVECELFLLKKSVEKNQYSYFHLLSGVDLPLKSNKEIFCFFENTQKEFVHFFSKEMPKYKREYYCLYHFNMRNYRKNIWNKTINKSLLIIQKILRIDRTRKNDTIFYTGANWFSITKNFASYVIEHEEWIYKTFKYTRSPDEFFLQTLLHNSTFKKNLFYKKFDDNYISCMRYIDWNRGNPYIFRKNDYLDLINSDYFFARKFDENIDREVIGMLLKNRKK